VWNRMTRSRVVLSQDPSEAARSQAHTT
jgi:hypothetical protein